MSSYNIIEELKYEFEKDCEETCDCLNIFKSKEFKEKLEGVKYLFYSKMKEFNFFFRGVFYQSKKSYKKNDISNKYVDNYTTYNRSNKLNRLNRLKRSNSASFIEMNVFASKDNIEQQNIQQEETKYAQSQLYDYDFSQNTPYNTPNNSPILTPNPPIFILSKPLISSPRTSPSSSCSSSSSSSSSSSCRLNSNLSQILTPINSNEYIEVMNDRNSISDDNWDIISN